MPRTSNFSDCRKTSRACWSLVPGAAGVLIDDDFDFLGECGYRKHKDRNHPQLKPMHDPIHEPPLAIIKITTLRADWTPERSQVSSLPDWKSAMQPALERKF